ncbi:MAG: flagellar motor protein MotA [Verrucomicrobiaceae bacterium]|nr:flagellar motor protein MotA [Verrucomicrobiaceae bacterium]
MDLFHSAVRFFQEGGFFMYPIAVILVFGIAISVERWVFLTSARGSNRTAFDEILPLLQKGDFKSVLSFASSSTAPVARIIASGVARLAHTQRRDDIEYAMEEGVMEALPRLEKRTQYLATLANVAMLLGLLGTISGLISAFAAVANVNPAEKAQMLSASIAEAMNATAFGLTSAIPMLLIHTLLQTKTTEIIDSLEMAGVKCLNILSDKRVLAQQTRVGE